MIVDSRESKILIKIGKHFEANASGNFAVSVVFLITIALLVVGFSFL
tara:strand:- start:33 stop:173 length:141 start_codon:yes stop_codon:yes gene_type:complete